MQTYNESQIIALCLSRDGVTQSISEHAQLPAPKDEIIILAIWNFHRRHLQRTSGKISGKKAPCSSA